MRSDAVKTGSQQAPHRSLFNALGLTKEEMERPLVGIVSSYNEIVPGHMNLDKVVAAVKQGVAMAGGTPIVFPAIAVCDGIAMGHVGMKYSLVTRGDQLPPRRNCSAFSLKAPEAVHRVHTFMENKDSIPKRVHYRNTANRSGIYIAQKRCY